MKNDIIFKPSDELTFYTVQPDVERLLVHLQDKSVTGLRFDLSQVKHCDSAGLALLIEAKRLCRYYKKPFSIDEMPKTVQALAAFCGVDALLS